MKIKIHKVTTHFIHTDQGKGYPVPINTSVQITYQINGISKIIDRGISIPVLRKDVIERIIIAAILQHEDEEKQKKELDILLLDMQGKEYTEENVKERNS